MVVTHYETEEGKIAELPKNARQQIDAQHLAGQLMRREVRLPLSISADTVENARMGSLNPLIQEAAAHLANPPRRGRSPFSSPVN